MPEVTRSSDWERGCSELITDQTILANLFCQTFGTGFFIPHCSEEYRNFEWGIKKRSGFAMLVGNSLETILFLRKTVQDFIRLIILYWLWLSICSTKRWIYANGYSLFPSGGPLLVRYCAGFWSNSVFSHGNEFSNSKTWDQSLKWHLCIAWPGQWLDMCNTVFHLRQRLDRYHQAKGKFKASSIKQGFLFVATFWSNLFYGLTIYWTFSW